MKGYNQLLTQMKHDEMCFFPVALIGINKNLPQSNQDERALDRVGSGTETKLALEYAVDFLRTDIFDMSSIDDSKFWESQWNWREDFRQFVNSVLDYYHYRALNEEQIQSLKARKDESFCSIL